MKNSEADADPGVLRLAAAQCIRALRRKTGISQENLAYAAGVDRGYMSGLERGIHIPTLLTIYKLLPYLAITFVEFATEFEHCVKRAKRNRT